MKELQGHRQLCRRGNIYSLSCFISSTIKVKAVGPPSDFLIGNYLQKWKGLSLKLPTFKKGIHPKEYKEYSQHREIEELPLPDEIFIPLQQHLGYPCISLVKKGDEVKTGQMIGKVGGFVSSPVHSSVTGKVKEIDYFPHPLGTKAQMIRIRRTGGDTWELLHVPSQWQDSSVEELRNIIQQAGIVGLGGAAFPTHVKLAPPEHKKIDTFILNGCECEPYLTADHRAMVEMTDKVIAGMAIIMKVLGTDKGYIGVENNKPDAIEVLRERIGQLNLGFKVIPLKVKYPQGAEKMLIDAILHRQVPAGGLPMDVGVVVHNVGTAMAIGDAVIEGKPLVSRIVSVTGDGIEHPKNVLARIGTPVKHLVDFCGSLKEETAQVVMGGPMMGVAQYDLSVPIVKSTSGIVCTTDSSKKEVKAFPCIRCGSCVSACPMLLLPTRLARLSEMEYFEEAEALGIFNCVECGCCAFICPSHIPLVQWIRMGKLMITEIKRKAAS
jgi:electron transport complex protein RnfC